MARTTGTKPQYKAIEYKGQEIRRYSNGMIKAVIDGKVYAVEDRGEATELIDSMTTQKGPEGPYGGFMKNPPVNCSRIVKDEEGLWVEAVACAFFCKDNQNCKVHKLLSEGAKMRIAKMSFHTMAKKCPHCEMEVEEDLDEIVVYFCGTAGDKRSGKYDDKCKQKKQKSRRTKR